MEEKLEKETEKACPEGPPGEGCQGRQCCKEDADCRMVAEQQSAQTRLSASR